jgi:stress response protein SCP2
MEANRRAPARQEKKSAGVEPELKEVVMGLHWSPQPEDAPGEPGNLDALCLLFDAQGHVLEAVHPGHPRNDNGSVLHTGDSPTGASSWDDERIFVFLDALPGAVSTLLFVVASADGRALGDVPGASCHVSDRVTEHEWIRADLTALGPRTSHCVATLQRGAAGWTLSPEVSAAHGETASALLAPAGQLGQRRERKAART